MARAYPGQLLPSADIVTIGGSNSAYVVTFDVPSATLSSLTIEGGNGANHVTTLRMTAGDTLNIQGGVTLLKKDSPAAIDGAGTISVSGGITATGGRLGSEGTITAGTDTTGGVLDLTGTGFITSPFVFAIGTAAPTTLEFNLAGGVVSPTAIIIEQRQSDARDRTLGRIVHRRHTERHQWHDPDGWRHAHGHQRHLIRHRGIKRLAEWLRHGSRPADRSGSGTANTITAIGGNLTLSTAIGSNSGLVFAIGSTDVSALQLNADPGDGNTFTFLGSDGELALTGVAASGFNDSIVGLDVAGTLTPTNLVHILGARPSRLHRGRSVPAPRGRSRYRTAPSCI